MQINLKLPYVLSTGAETVGSSNYGNRLNIAIWYRLNVKPFPIMSYIHQIVEYNMTN